MLLHQLQVVVDGLLDHSTMPLTQVGQPHQLDAAEIMDLDILSEFDIMAVLQEPKYVGILQPHHHSLLQFI